MYRGHDAIEELCKRINLWRKRHGWRRVNVDVLRVLGEGNDPFYCGIDFQQTGAEWFAELWRRHGFTSGVHLRRVHYRLASTTPQETLPDGSPYANTVECDHYLKESSKWARYLGLVSADVFVDRRNPPPHLYMQPPQWSLERPYILMDELEAWTFPSIESDLGRLLSLPIPHVTVGGYGYHSSNQPYLVEVWIEKSTMDDVLLPVCQEWYVNLVTSLGFQSLTGIVNFLCPCQRIVPNGTAGAG